MAYPPDALMHDDRLRRHPGAKLLAVALWWPVAPQEREPRNWQTVETLAAKAGLTRSAAFRAKRVLVDIGWAVPVRESHPATGAIGKVLRLSWGPITGTSPSHDRDVPPPGFQSPTTGIPKSHHRDSKVPPPGPIGKKGNGGKIDGMVAASAPIDVGAPGRLDPRLAMADAINAQTDRYQAARTPTTAMRGFATTPEHAVLVDRYAAALDRCPPGSSERARLAAARLTTPSEPVLRRACEDLGGVEQVAQVFEWAWTEYAAGRLTVGRADDAGAALRDAFRGEGRWWRGIVEAHTRRRRATAPGRGWQPPDLGDVERASDDELTLPDWGAR